MPLFGKFSVALPAVADAAAVAVFVGIGRRSHDESGAVLGLVHTGWPFLAGAALGWAVTRGWRCPLAVVPTGVGAWLGAVGVGMLLRWLTGAGTAPAFVLVATITLGILVPGWRAVLARVTRRRAAGRAG